MASAAAPFAAESMAALPRPGRQLLVGAPLIHGVDHTCPNKPSRRHRRRKGSYSAQAVAGRIGTAEAIPIEDVGGGQ
jgi:hypothetical protein